MQRRTQEEYPEALRTRCVHSPEKTSMCAPTRPMRDLRDHSPRSEVRASSSKTAKKSVKRFPLALFLTMLLRRFTCASTRLTCSFSDLNPRTQFRATTLRSLKRALKLVKGPQNDGRSASIGNHCQGRSELCDLFGC